MMPEPLLSHEPDASPARPFPWFCPRCRHQEVSRTVFPYQCQRVYQGQPITVAISDLAVPKCGNCGELVFDDLAEQQIDRAFLAQTSALNNADGATEKDWVPKPETGHSSLVKD